MKSKNRRLIAIAVMVAAMIAAGPGAAQYFGESVSWSGGGGGDVYTAGGTVQILSRVDGDLVAAGGTITVTDEITGDVLASGGSITLTGRVGDDIRAAGGTVTVAGNVGGDAIIAGGSVSLAADRRVRGRAWLAGASVDVDADVDGEVRIGGRNVSLSGRYGGDVRVLSEDLRIESGAHIAGDLHYGGPREATIDPGATIEGRVVYSKAEFGKHFEFAPPMAGGLALLAAILAVSNLIVFWILPHGVVETVRVIAGEPLKSVAMGFVVLIVTPVLALILGVTVLAAPLAVALFLTYFVLLIAGYLMAVAALGWIIFRVVGPEPGVRTLRRCLALIVAAIAVAATGFLLPLGALVGLLLVLFGGGATAVALFRAGR
jgi:cytoskeletal protein CcmA (bactofilin family)